MGFTRRFASRVDSDNFLNCQEAEGQDEVPTLSARIEEKQKRLENRPRSTCKVYPQTNDPEQGQEERQKQSSLHARICIFLCTVLPLLTMAATFHRLWYMGIISFDESVECPANWTQWSGNCYQYIPIYLSWPDADQFCKTINEGANYEISYLVDPETEAENGAVILLTDKQFWSAGKLSSQTWRWEPGARTIFWKKQINKLSREYPYRDKPVMRSIDNSKPNNQETVLEHNSISTDTVSDSNADESRRENFKGIGTEIVRILDWNDGLLENTTDHYSETTDIDAKENDSLKYQDLGKEFPVLKDFFETLRNEANKKDVKEEIEECLSIVGGTWYSENCITNRGFICKFPLTEDAKRNRKICLNKSEYKIYNRQHFYKCMD